ncbi:MAG: arginase family protein [Vampirovibrionales bacterium]
MDIIDPSFLPGTAPPSPKATLTELLNWVSPLKTANIVGFDVVELSPHYDHSGMSAVTVAKLRANCC